MPLNSPPIYYTVLYLFQVNGQCVQLNVSNNSSDQICQWVEHLRSRSGNEVVRLRKMWHTETPSVQGAWTPFTNLNPSVAAKSLPDESLSQCPSPVTATDYLSNILKTDLKQ